MDLTDIGTIKKLLRDNNLPALKKFGQNFLVDKTILEKIIESAQLKKDDIVLEIGPGLGVLTKELARQSKQVIAIEKDERIIGLLKQNLVNFNNVEIIEGDVLDNFEEVSSKSQAHQRDQSEASSQNPFEHPSRDPSEYSSRDPSEYSSRDPFSPRRTGLAGASEASLQNQRTGLVSVEQYKIVANLPYNIALFVIRKFIEAKNPPQEMILMLQKEVAEKLCSKKGSLPKIAVEFYAKTEFLFKVPKTAFHPQPKVDGAVIKIKNIQENLPNVDEKLFFKILKTGFSYPRKTILNNLSKIKEKQDAKIWLKNSGIESKKRPENLTLSDWVKLCNGFQK